MEHLQRAATGPAAPVQSASKQYLTFRVARKDFAMEAEHVRGILPLHDLIRTPDGPPDVAGFVRFAGQTVPVLDVALRLQLRFASRGSRPKIVIVEHPGAAFSGFIADRVSDVVVYRSRDLRNGVLQGLGRPRKLITLSVLAPEKSTEELMLQG